MDCRAFWISLIFVLGTSTACWRTAEDIQRDYAKKLRPSELKVAYAPAAPAERPLRTMKLRVYVDEQHRGQTLKFDARFTEQVARASEVMRHHFGVVLEIESFRAWPRKSMDGELQRALTELVQTDPGTDVDWVVGLVSPMSVFAASHDQLGMAHLFGRHVVLRSMESLGEVENLTRILKALPVAERERLFQERRLHKETSVLLHEIGHTLGAVHERQWDWLMSPVYDDKQAAFSEAAVRLMEVGLAHRDNGTNAEARAAWGRAWREAAAQIDPKPWSDAEWKESSTLVAEHLEGQTPRARTDMSRADIGRFNQAQTLQQNGDVDAAMQILRSLAERYPTDPHVHGLICTALRAAKKDPMQTIGRCRAAARIAPEDSRIALTLAHALLDMKDLPGGIEVLRDAEARMAGGSEAALWGYLAELYRQGQSPTLAEGAAAHVSTTDSGRSVAEWAEGSRRWSGLPRGAKIEPDREHEVLDAMEAIGQDLGAGRMDRARQRSRYLQETFGQLPSGASARCEIAAASGAPVHEVTRHCEAALKAWEELVFPHFVLGAFQVQQRQWSSAQRHLERAVELDPRWEPAWRRLAAVYADRKQPQKLEVLQADFRKRFSRELQPLR